MGQKQNKKETEKRILKKSVSSTTLFFSWWISQISTSAAGTRSNLTQRELITKFKARKSWPKRKIPPWGTHGEPRARAAQHSPSKPTNQVCIKSFIISTVTFFEWLLATFCPKQSGGVSNSSQEWSGSWGAPLTISVHSLHSISLF